MAKYLKTVNLDRVIDKTLLQKGQWVTQNGVKGVWICQNEQKKDVVMWHGAMVKSKKSKLQRLIEFLDV